MKVNCYYYQKNKCVNKRAILVNAGNCPYINHVLGHTLDKCNVRRKIKGFKV